MTRILTTVFTLSAFSMMDASATQLDNLFPAVKTKVEKYCPQTLSSDEINTLRKDEIVAIGDIDYFADNGKKIPSLEDEALVLCSGKYSQNRSTPGRVDCSFCKEDKTNHPLLSINLHITKDVDETLAKRDEEDSLTDETSSSPEIQS